MKYSIKILESKNEITNRILKALLPDIQKYMQTAINIMKVNLPFIIRDAITNTEEYSSLIGGKLKYEFGIPDPEIKIAGLLSVWSQNINISYSQPIIFKDQIKSSFSISMIRVDFSDVLYTDYAKVYDIDRGYVLPWLEWLVLEGNKVIVKDHRVVFGGNRRSRTGFAIMRGDSGSAWKVPAQFAGTESDNWITRAIDSSIPDVYDLLEEALRQ